MSLLDKKTIEMIQRILGKDFSAKWEGIERIEQKNSTKEIVTVANTGLFSSGKSMLFNALLEQTAEERFKVGATPTTKKGEREKLNAYVEIIDTPGINANDEDDTEAFHSLMEADIILAVHNIKTGMLDKCEYDWLKRIVSEMDREEISKRLVFVCTWIDESGTEEDRKKKVDEIRRQLKEILGIEIDFWEVSSKRYYMAREKNKPELEKASKIPQLREYLMKKAEEYSAVSKELRRNEIIVLCGRTKEFLQKEKDKIVRQINEEEKKVCKKYEIKKKAWKSILDNFKEYRKVVRKSMEMLEKEEDDYDAELLQELSKRL